MTGISANNVHGQDIEHAGTCRNIPEKWRNMPENGKYLVKYQNTGTCRNTVEKLNKKTYKKNIVNGYLVFQVLSRAEIFV